MVKTGIGIVHMFSLRSLHTLGGVLSVLLLQRGQTEGRAEQTDEGILHDDWALLYLPVSQTCSRPSLAGDYQLLTQNIAAPLSHSDHNLLPSCLLRNAGHHLGLPLVPPE